MHKDITYNPLQKLSEKHIEEDCNVVVLAPTSSGKTIVAEQYLFTAIKNDLKGVYLSPLKALTEEKKRSWGGKYEMTVATGDYAQGQTFQDPLILMTTESLDSKTRGNPKWMQQIGAIAVDEAHLLGSPSRGDALEIGLMRFTAINRAARIILLSATIPNAKELAEWLTRMNGKPTAIVETDWRPVSQDHHLVKSGSKPWDTIRDTKKTVNYVMNNFPEKQILVFVHAIGRGLSLSKTFGCPFHYSKLTKENRAGVEKAFIDKKIRILVATSTLAYGVNLPADVVVISGGMRGPTVVDPIDLKQEAGRSGRYGMSDHGDVYYVFEDFLADELFESCQNVPDVCSVLDQRLYFHIVSFVQREGMQRQDIKDFCARSFQGHLDVDGHIEKLQKCGALEEGDYLTTTKIGKGSALMYIDPLDLGTLYRNLLSKPTDLEEIARAFAEIPSNAYPCFVPEDIEEIAVNCKYPQQTIVATCLYHWMKGRDLTGTFFSIIPALKRDLDRWISGLSIAGLKKDYLDSIAIMLVNGISKDLVDLISIKGIGRVKAMKLFAVGITNKEEMLAATKVAPAIIGPKLFGDLVAVGNRKGLITFNF